MSARRVVRVFAAVIVAAIGVGTVPAAQAGTIRLTGGDGPYRGARVFRLTGMPRADAGDPGATGGAASPGNVFRTLDSESAEAVRFDLAYDWTIASQSSPGGLDWAPDPSADASAVRQRSHAWIGGLANYERAPGTGHAASDAALRLAVRQIQNPQGSRRAASVDDRQAEAWLSEATADPAAAPQSTTANLRVLDGTAGVADPESLAVMVPLPPAVWLGLAVIAGLGAAGLVRRSRRAEMN